MKMLVSASLATAIAISAPVYAQDATQGSETSATVNSASEADEGDKMVCKRTAVTGTRIKKKVCHTRDQWDRIEEASKRAADEIKGLGGIDSTRRGG